MRAETSLLLVSLLLGGCYASNVVAPRDRMVRTDLKELKWRPATAADLAGLYASVAITGDAALTLRRVDYWFGADGRFAAAALQDDDDEGPTFQTANGRWSLTDGGLVLGDQEPAECTAAEEHLRLRMTGGEIVLRRETGS